MSTSVTLSSVTFTDTDFAAFGFQTSVTVNGTAYPRWQALFVAAMADAGRAMTTTSATSKDGALTGSQSWVLAADIPFAVGSFVTIARTSAPTALWYYIQTTGYVSATKTLTGTVITSLGSTSSVTDWTVQIAGARGAEGTVTFASDAEARAAALTTKGVTPANLAAATIMQGVHLHSYAGNCLYPTTTSGGTISATETGTHKGMVPYAEFSESTTTYFTLSPGRMPPSWDGGTVTFDFAGYAASGSGDVKIFLQARSRASGDTIDAAWGTAAGVTITTVSTTAEKRSSFSAAITIANSPAAGDKVEYRFYRDPADGSDTLSGKFRMTDFDIAPTYNAAKDA